MTKEYVSLGIDDETATELRELTGQRFSVHAVEAAVKFTLMHDKDSVQEALKS